MKWFRVRLNINKKNTKKNEKKNLHLLYSELDGACRADRGKKVNFQSLFFLRY